MSKSSGTTRYPIQNDGRGGSLGTRSTSCSSSSRPAIGSLCLKATSWRLPSRSRQCRSFSSSATCMTWPSTRTCRPSHRKTSAARGFSASCLPFGLSRLDQNAKPRSSKPSRTTARADGLPSRVAVASTTGTCSSLHHAPKRRSGSGSGSGCLVRILLGGELARALKHVLEVALLDRQRPGDELADLIVPGRLVHRLQDRPVTDLGGLGHRQELEAVERVGVVVEIGRHHLCRLLLHLACLVEDRGLLAFEARRDLLAAVSGLRRLFRHSLQRLREARVLFLRQLRDLPAGGLCRHRKAGDLGELLLEVRQLRHVAPFLRSFSSSSLPLSGRIKTTWPSRSRSFSRTARPRAARLRAAATHSQRSRR